MREHTGRDISDWPRDGAHRGELDHAIDRAVRDMMSVDADPAFRARVLARLERRQTHWTTSARVAVATVGSIAVVLGLVLTRPPADAVRKPAVARTTVPESTTPARPETLAEVSRAVDDTPEPVRAPAAKRSPRRNVTQSVPVGTLVATVADDGPIASAAVMDDPQAQVEPHGVSPLAPSAIRVAPIVITPLAPIPPLEITPLSPQVRRD